MSKKRIIGISAVILAAILFGIALWLNRPVDMTYDLTLTDQDGETTPISLEVTINRYLYKPTEITGTARFNDRDFRLFPVDTSTIGLPRLFIDKLRGGVTMSIGRENGSTDNILYIFDIIIDRKNEITQLTVSGGGQDNLYALDPELTFPDP